MNPQFQIHVVTDGQKQTEELLEAVKQVAGKVDAIQLRYKAAPALDLYHLAEQFRLILAGTSTKLFINDRVDVALAVEADGVHLAGKSLPVERVRAIVPPRMIIGRSVHSVPEAVEAERQGADYVTFGHVFATSSKPGLPPKGPAALRAVVEAVSIPVMAIGGITPANAGEVARTRCAGVAVIGAVMAHHNPAEAALALRSALEAAREHPEVPLHWPKRQ
ncbi:MAG: thiamine phosphate synthase [Alicyclobacillaceae bacterium]|nr:thiamine phosphate synthase [Alicyclobacillaceae bacterium]